jgi:hypothetical protein
VTTCPFCREAIAEGAIKCKHCQSYLIPIAQAGPQAAEPKSVEAGEGRVTYVLDQSLVRFGKFVAGALAIFFVIGVYGFGLDIKGAVTEMRQAGDKIDAAEDKVREVERKIEQTSTSLTKKTEELEQAQSELTALTADYRKAVAELEQAKLTAQEAVTKANDAVREIGERVDLVRTGSNQAIIDISAYRIKTLSGQQEIVKAEIRTEKPGKFRRGNGGGGLLESKLWPVGATLRVRFLDGDPALRARVAAAAGQWTQHANIRFEFESTVADAEVRVSFRPGQGSWGSIGTDAIAIPAHEPTVNFGWLTNETPDDELVRVVLHEFGHVLGLFHEHTNPNKSPDFDWDNIYKDLSGPPNSWDKATIEANISKNDGLIPYRDFDPQSIMAFPMPKTWFKDLGFEIGLNRSLSESDRRFIAELYPPA